MTVIDFKKNKATGKSTLRLSEKCVEAMLKKEMEAKIQSIISKVTR